MDGLALVAYVAGSGIHFTADSQKKRYKAMPETKGRLLDKGLWRYPITLETSSCMYWASVYLGESRFNASGFFSPAE